MSSPSSRHFGEDDLTVRSATSSPNTNANYVWADPSARGNPMLLARCAPMIGPPLFCCCGHGASMLTTQAICRATRGKCQPTTTASSRRGVGRKREGKQGAHAEQWDTRPVRQFSARLGYPIRIWMHAIVNPALAEREIIIVPGDTSRPLWAIWRTASAIPDA